MNNIKKDTSGISLRQRVEKEFREEYFRQAGSLRERDDFFKELDYFLQVLAMPLSPHDAKKRFDKPLIGLYCVQVPLELLDAFGLQPVRLGIGSSAVQRLTSGHIPVLACPPVKSCIGAFYLEKAVEELCDIIILPTTCDWNIKLPQMIPDEFPVPFHIMELPHIKESERARNRWLEEIYELKDFLRERTGRRADRKKLLTSIDRYMKAWATFIKLTEFRRDGLISGFWSIILANAFMVDNVESWTDKVGMVLSKLKEKDLKDKPGIFLAGSPIFFPYLKIPELIEEAGMNILADELCTSERLFTSVIYDEPSEHGLLKALAERYYLACNCPTFADDDRRLNNILETMRANNIKGLVYHLLKGCHPYDIESFYFEKVIKENGFKFIKIETDYSEGDRQNILTRLEAFRGTLVS